MAARTCRPWLANLTFLLGVSVFAANAFAQAKPPAEPQQFEPFTGVMMVRQEGGQLYYKIFLSKGEVIGGFEGFGQHETQYHRVVGGWYDGIHLSLLMQSTAHNWGDKWFSHCHQFLRKGDKLELRHTLYGFGRTLELGGVHTPHIVEQLEQLPEEQVRRLAAANIAGKALTVLNVEDPLIQLLADLEVAVGDLSEEGVNDLIGQELLKQQDGKLPAPLGDLRESVAKWQKQGAAVGPSVQFKNIRKTITADMLVNEGVGEKVMPVEFTVEHTAEGWKIVDAKIVKKDP